MTGGKNNLIKQLCQKSNCRNLHSLLLFNVIKNRNMVWLLSAYRRCNVMNIINNKTINESDWLSTGPILAPVGQCMDHVHVCNWTV